MEVDSLVDSIPSSWHLLKQKLSGDSYQKIADRYNTSKQNIHQRIQSLISVHNPDLQNSYLDKPSDALKVLESFLVTEIVNPDKIQKASMMQLAAAYGILYDKRRLEEGKSTENIDFRALLLMETDIKSRLSSVKNIDTNNSDIDTE